MGTNFNCESFLEFFSLHFVREKLSEKLGLPAKPGCRGNRINSETLLFGFFPKIEFPTSLYKKNPFLTYGHLTY